MHEDFEGMDKNILLISDERSFIYTGIFFTMKKSTSKNVFSNQTLFWWSQSDPERTRRSPERRRRLGRSSLQEVVHNCWLLLDPSLDLTPPCKHRQWSQLCMHRTCQVLSRSKCRGRWERRQLEEGWNWHWRGIKIIRTFSSFHQQSDSKEIFVFLKRNIA